MASLKIESLTKSFSGKKTLDDVSLTTADGELVVVLGPSGCGKSTLLRLIAGLEKADNGQIFIGSRQVDNLPPQKRNVALVFQNYALYPHMTVAQNLAFPLKVARFSKDEIRRRVGETADMIGLGDRLDARPAELSGGQRQRVALGRAIIRQPDIYLLDEPLSNLDAELRSKMRRELVELQKRLGTTTVYVTHDQVEALTMADRLVVLESGKIRQIGTAEEIYRHPADTFVASFIGSPQINLFLGNIENGRIQPFDLPVESYAVNPSLTQVIIGIRSEDVILVSDDAYIGTINHIEYLGDRAVISLRYQDCSLTAVTDPGGVKEGERRPFKINSRNIILFDKETGINLKRNRGI